MIFGICSWYFFILKGFTMLIFLNICPSRSYKTKTIQKARNERFKFVKWYCSKFKLRYWEIPVKDYRPGWRFTLIKTIGSRKITTYIPVHECLYKTSLPPAKKINKLQSSKNWISQQASKEEKGKVFIRDEGYDEKKSKCHLSIWAEAAECVIVPLHPYTWHLQISPIQ